MRYLTLAEVLGLHRRIIDQYGGAHGVRDLGGVESAVAQPQMTFGGDTAGGTAVAIVTGVLTCRELAVRSRLFFRDPERKNRIV